MRRGERGFTIVELAMMIAVVTIVTGAASMGIFQVVEVTERSSDQMTTMRQVQNAGYWISHDTQMAQTITVGDDPGTPGQEEFLTLNWANWESGEVHKIIYILEDMADELSRFKRQHLTYDAEGVETGNEMTLVAENIDSASFSDQGSTWKLTIQTRSGDETETREYTIINRASM